MCVYTYTYTYTYTHTDLYFVVCVSSSARVDVLALWLMFSVLQTSTRFVSSRERTASTTSTWSSTGRTSRAVRSRCVWENRDRAGMLDSSLLTVPVWNEEPQVTHIARWHRAELFWERSLYAVSPCFPHCEYWSLHVSVDQACGEEVGSLRPLTHAECTYCLSRMDYRRYFSWIKSVFIVTRLVAEKV